MNGKEKGVMDLIREDGVLNTKYTYDEFYNQNAAAPVNEDDLLEEAFLTYLETCGKQTV